MSCPHCQSGWIVKNGTYLLKEGSSVQHFVCKACGKRFSERTKTPMARLRTPASTVSLALKMRSEGMGVRASGRVLDVSHSTVLRWEERMVAQSELWSPKAPQNSELTLEHDELYTRVGQNLPPQ